MRSWRARAVILVAVLLCACSSTDGRPAPEAPSTASSPSTTPSAASPLATSPLATSPLATPSPTVASSSEPSVSGAPSATASEPPTAAPGLGLGSVGLTGVNDPSCHSSHPPVLLLHGTVSSIAVDFPVLVPALLTAGLCVYGADYGLYGTRSVRSSATSFAAVVAQVRAFTGAATVDVVGFSQGGLVLRTALRYDGLAAVVQTAALISPSFHGTTSALVSSFPGGVCGACTDQAAGSALLTGLAAGGDLDGAVRYAVAVTSTDVIVTPWQRQIPDGPADRVRSVVLDQRCPKTQIRHQDMARDRRVVGWVVAALNRRGDVQANDLVCTPGTG